MSKHKKNNGYLKDNAKIDDELSRSILINNKSSNTPAYNVGKKVYAWVDDNTVTKCENCKRDFTILLRKHHCRMCGKIFCGDCSRFKQVIPEDILSEDSKRGTLIELFTPSNSEKRVCIKCNTGIEKFNKVKKIVDVFFAIRLDILELKKARQKHILWENAADYCLSKIKNIPYKLPMIKYTKLERELLWTNAQYFWGHSKYLLCLLKSCRTDNDVNKVIDIMENKNKITRIDCKVSMCSKNCSKTLTSIDARNLLADCFNRTDNCDSLKRIALNHLICSEEEFICYIPDLVYYLQNDNGLLSDYLIKRCTRNYELLERLFHQLQFHPKTGYNQAAYTKTLDKLKQVFSEKQHENTLKKLSGSNAFLNTIKKIGKLVCDEGKHYDEIKDGFKLNKDVIYPLNPKLKIRKIKLNKIKFKNSASKPIIIPCETTKGEQTTLLYKREDVIKDQTIINLIKLASIIIKREEGIDLDIVTYNVLPIDKNSGIIEIIDKADTVYFITEKIKSSILNYMLEKNDDMTINELKKRYIKSVAAYSVITYLLGIGDRHLDNIMVTRDARIFHIDFGYILGKDPVFNNPGIRITPDMIEALGGPSSRYYEEFVKLCSTIYNCLRRNVDIFVNMLLLLPKQTNINISKEEIKDQIVKRFLPGQDEVSAHFHIIKKLESHSYTDRIKDWCHYHSKEKTISSSLSYFGQAAKTMVNFWSVYNNTDNKEIVKENSDEFSKDEYVRSIKKMNME